MASYIQGYDEKRFVTTVNRNFLCLICFNVLKDPVLCPRNQHCFCRGCITKHLENSQLADMEKRIARIETNQTNVQKDMEKKFANLETQTKNTNRTTQNNMAILETKLAESVEKIVEKNMAEYRKYGRKT